MEKIIKFFKIEERGSTVKTEVIAGLTTFLAMAYILFVNPNTLTDPLGNGFVTTTMDWGAVFTATAIAAIVGTLIMGLYAKYPVALAPGMGMNSVFVFTFYTGSGYTWQQGLVAVLISGLLFLVISLTGLREKIINAIPQNLKFAIGAGIGLFIAFIGLYGAGLVKPGGAILTMGNLKYAGTLISVFGLVLTTVLYVKKVKGSILLGIIGSSIVAVLVSLFPNIDIASLPSGVIDWPTAPHFGSFVKGFTDGTWDMGFVIVIFTFFFLDFFDTAGTLVSVGEQAGLLDEKGNLIDADKALLADSTATVVGAVVGTSSTTSYIESLAGIEEGGRTGLTAVVVAICFFIAMFFSPLLSVVPAAATAPALIFVGVLMARQLGKIEWQKIEIAIPAFLTIIIMPLTYSIANGIAIGFIAYIITMVAAKKAKDVSPLMYGLGAFFVLYFVVTTIF